MEFGKLNDTEQLSHMDWELPPLDAQSASFLSTLRPGSQKVWMGTPAWGHKEWVGRIYPPKTKATDFLFHYSRYFNTIELNTSHYRIPTPEQVEKWKSQVPDDFVFCPKILQGISHDHKGLIDPVLHKNWYQFLESLQSHLGPCFLQLPPYFDYGQKGLLFEFLKLWPDDFRLALEFRHPSWFQDSQILPALNQYLQTRKIGLVITDVAGRRDVLHSSVSASFTMIRFIGNDLHETDFVRARQWNEHLESMKKAGLQETFFFVHQPDDILAPEMSDYLRGLSYFSDLAERRSLEENISLFD